MKMVIAFAAILLLASSLCFAQGFTPDAIEWMWEYEADTTITATNSIDNDDLSGNAPLAMGYEELYWEITMEELPDSSVDSVQFTLWGLTIGDVWDSLAAIPENEFSGDSSSYWWATPNHQSLGASDSVWIYKKFKWQALWLADSETVWHSRSLTNPRWTIRLLARKK